MHTLFHSSVKSKAQPDHHSHNRNHPVHTNLDYARKNQHGQLVVDGTLVFSLVVGMTVPDISGKAIANLGYEDIKHLRPVFINDTLYAKTIVLDKRESKSKPDRGIVHVETVGYNQHDEAVMCLVSAVSFSSKNKHNHGPFIPKPDVRPGP